jgi:outer membrane protein OmpA-like peptidoglycan-associated protein
VKLLENLIKRVPVVGDVVNLIGVADPLSATIATQRTPQPPAYTVTFTADVLAEGAPQPLAIPDHVINFDNDSASISSKETTELLAWAKQITKDVPYLREAIRSGMVPILITGRASVRGNATHNFVLSQKRVEAVRLALQGAASAAGGDRTQGGIFGSERVKVDAEADGDFHDPKPSKSEIDLDRLVQISIDGKAAACATDRLKDGASGCHDSAAA